MQHTQQITAEKPNYLTRTEAAKFLRISVPTLINRCKDGTLHPVRLGRLLLFRYDDLMTVGKEKVQ